MPVDRSDLKNAIHDGLVAQLITAAPPDQQHAFENLAQALADALVDHFLANMSVSVTGTYQSTTITSSGGVT